jgi:hypothetical protein
VLHVSIANDQKIIRIDLTELVRRSSLGWEIRCEAAHEEDAIGKVQAKMVRHHIRIDDAPALRQMLSDVSSFIARSNDLALHRGISLCTHLKQHFK